MTERITLQFAPALQALELQLVAQPSQPAELAVAFIGPPGPPGGGAGATYTHTQAIAAAVWTVPHNLGRYPSVTVADHLGNVITPDVRYLGDDMVQITHGTPLTGYAYCN